MKKRANQFAQSVIKWTKKYGRHDLPWQQQKTPYRVWVSEIMLQQTQVTTVIPYYLRFMQSFPTLKKLANASLDKVLTHWAGLGYYSRAKYLHQTAQIIVRDHHGEFPHSVEELIKLPGIGRSTAGAILSLSLQIAAPILDGNVKRVFARNFAISDPINNAQGQQALWQIAENELPSHQADIYNQGLMDLGATICLKTKPKCTECPLSKMCIAYQTQTQANYPVKIIKKTSVKKSTQLIILQNEAGEILLEKRPSTGIWSNLWSLPELPPQINLKQWCHNLGSIKVLQQKKLVAFKHIFSHFTLDIQPVLLKVKLTKKISLDTKSQRWLLPKQQEKLGVAAPIKKIILALADVNATV